SLERSQRGGGASSAPTRVHTRERLGGIVSALVSVGLLRCGCCCCASAPLRAVCPQEQTASVHFCTLCHRSCSPGLGTACCEHEGGRGGGPGRPLSRPRGRGVGPAQRQRQRASTSAALRTGGPIGRAACCGWLPHSPASRERRRP
ncbi:hypothetical protein BDZ91DRAFT_813041, partial [Kalaharituber pfeilii]